MKFQITGFSKLVFNRANRPVLILLVFTFCILLVGSCDSWLRFPAPRSDNYWFFMCGKSWMSGLLPYKDFTDYKGPLLFLVYGIGYLITPHNFYGVFIFELLFYWLTFYFLYKTALLVIGKENLSLISSMLMAILFFYPGMHYEILAEDYCHLFQAIAFFVLVKSLYCKEYTPILSFWLGLCCGATLLFKYSFTVSLLVPTFFIFIWVCRNRLGALKFIALFTGGFGAIVLPFIIYFLCEGCLGDFINEYFLKTGNSIVDLPTDHVYAMTPHRKWPFNIISVYRAEGATGEFMRFVVLFLIIGLYKFRKAKYFDLVLFLWYGVSVLMLTIVLSGGRDYYLNALPIFAYGGIIGLVKLFPNPSKFGVLMAGGVIVAVVAIGETKYHYSEFYNIDKFRPMEETYRRLGKIVENKKLELGRKPTVVYYNGSTFAIHVYGDAIAGARYWGHLPGSSPEMTEQHREDIFRNSPDFVMVYSWDTDFRERLEHNDYKEVLTFPGKPYEPTDTLESRTLYEKL